MRYFKKIEGGPFGDFEKFSKKMRIFNSLIVPKNLKKDTLLNFLTIVVLQNIKKMKGGPFFENKSQKAEKGEGGSHMVEKSENLLLRKFCKKN